MTGYARPTPSWRLISAADQPGNRAPATGKPVTAGDIRGVRETRSPPPRPSASSPSPTVVASVSFLARLGPAAEVDEGFGGAPLEAGVLQLRGDVLEGGRDQGVDVLRKGPHRRTGRARPARRRSRASTAVAGPTASRRRASGVVVCSSMSVASRARIRGMTSARPALAAASAARRSRSPPSRRWAAATRRIAADQPRARPSASMASPSASAFSARARSGSSSTGPSCRS